jgi:putative addiction module component (TIGR02574 family)
MDDATFNFDALSVPERIQLAEDLWDSIDARTADIPLAPGELAVLDSRLEDLERVPDSGAPWDEVSERIQERLRRCI